MSETDGFYRREVQNGLQEERNWFNLQSLKVLLALDAAREAGHQCRDNLKHRFSDLGFEVKCFNDLKAELLLKIHETSTSSHVDANCFVCVFLSHGESNHI